MRSDIRRQTGLQLSVYVHKELDKIEKAMFREDGYYWVTWNGARRIIEYSGGKWWITSNRWADEECLENINENRIIEDGTE
jgi:hypothetical protein